VLELAEVARSEGGQSDCATWLHTGRGASPDMDSLVPPRVDPVTIFDDPSVLTVVEQMLPDSLAKGRHYTVDQFIGRDEVEAAGGGAVSIPIVPGYSTTAIIESAQRAVDGRR
jgi:hypothetical protein